MNGEGGPGLALAHEMARLMDALTGALLDYTTQHVYPAMNPTAGERLCALAVGGYGRGELAPFSDIDLLFLSPYKQTPWGEQVVEYTLYALWDLGLRVGHATRSVDESIRLARTDHAIRTTLLEARPIWGDRRLFGSLSGRLAREVIANGGADFIEAKLNERDARHLRFGDSRYVIEPNVKDGKGGLRDLHTLLWIARHCFGIRAVADLVPRQILSPREYRSFRRALSFLWTVRCHLHYLAGRAEERLTVDLQPEIGRRLGYADRRGSRGVERFMKYYFLVAKDVGDLTRVFCAALEDA
ncbi:MAG: bifunctional uridylyltransferase/uridylyl-removing protein, partial [Alphaproteobacteria bacterium]|nr:bifunctional uridylyltransferase/uridylyl-removing protein [Alphaproteobacteria bacterium]